MRYGVHDPMCPWAVQMEPRVAGRPIGDWSTRGLVIRSGRASSLAVSGSFFLGDHR